jgi:RimJ/RimL family protein N-acetyltransferase
VELVEQFELTDGVVLLTRPSDVDIDRIAELCQDPEIQEWTAELPSPYLRSDAEIFVHELVPRAWRENRPVWGIRDAATKTLHGVVSVDLDAGGEVGFWMGAESRNRGWTTRALRLVVKAAFQGDADHLRWRAFVGNAASRRVAIKVGFKMDGTIRRALQQRGVWRDAWVATLLPDEVR